MRSCSRFFSFRRRGEDSPDRNRPLARRRGSVRRAAAQLGLFILSVGAAGAAVPAFGQEFLLCAPSKADSAAELDQYEHRLADGRRILHAFAGDDLAAFFGFTPRIEVIARGAPNAFAIHPHGIAISTALLDMVDSSSELAFVLAHELGHLRQDAPATADAFAPIERDFNVRAAHELAADTFAIRLLESSGFDPRAGGAILSKIGVAVERSGASPEAVLPSLQARINALKRQLH